MRELRLSASFALSLAGSPINQPINSVVGPSELAVP